MSSGDSATQKHFLLTGHVEGISFLILLFIAMPLKYFFDFPMAVTIVGMIHGVLFIWFMYQIYNMYDRLKWPLKKCFYAFLLSIVPFGTFFLNRL